MTSLPAAGMAWSYALREPKEKPFRMLPHCAAHRASQKPVWGKSSLLGKQKSYLLTREEFAATGPIGLAHPPLHPFLMASSALARGQTRKSYLCLY